LGTETTRRAASRREAEASELMPLAPVVRRVLIVDDEEVVCKYLQRVLKGHGCEATYRLSAPVALEALASAPYSIVIADIKMPGMGGMELLEKVRARFPQVSVVIITGHGSLKSAVDAMKLGASDYLTKPFQPEELCLVVDRVLSQRKLLDEIAQLRHELADRDRFGDMLSQDPKMRGIFATIARVAPTDATVLITGETGTGKELVARALHENSRRADRRLMAINCGAFPESLLESELFGHEAGAFTGAVAAKAGIFEVADGGTLLLDEIGNVSLPMQVKLLRVLETMEYRRVGGVETRTCDVRIIAATHVDLEAAAEEGTFRRDLFYRINVVPISLPPLRERLADLPHLVAHFVGRYGPKMNPSVQDIAPEALLKLLRHSWPGNIRQLEHVIQRALILADGPTILPEHLPIDELGEPEGQRTVAFNEHLPLGEVKDTLVEFLERSYLDKVLRLYRGNVRRTARHAGLSERSIYHKLKKYHLDRRAYKRLRAGAPR